VIPEHVHLLMSEAPTVSPSTVLQVLKQKVSRELGSTRPTLTTTQQVGGPHPPKTTEGSFWQRRFYDFNVSRQDQRETLLHARKSRKTEFSG
jgi:REP element-mobilizing transposase RayT